MSDCKTCGDSTDSTTDENNSTDDTTTSDTCYLQSLSSSSLDITGECPDLTIELKQEEESTCTTVDALMPNDILTLERNGQCIQITAANLMKALTSCQKECL